MEGKTSLVEQAHRVLHADAQVPDEEPRRLPMWLRDPVERHLTELKGGDDMAQNGLQDALARVRHYLCAALPDGAADAALGEYGFPPEAP